MLKFCHAHQGVHVSAAQTTDRWPCAARSHRSASSRCALDHLLMSLLGSISSQLRGHELETTSSASS
eukprot:7698195-Heterocapsa_arctica.AAC.1